MQGNNFQTLNFKKIKRLESLILYPISFSILFHQTLPIILNIDTATEKASICLSMDGVSIAYAENDQQKEHGSFVHTAIEKLLKAVDINLQNIDAFAVTSGPGSYTGLRVGMATAKGFCYALSKPLILVNTLQVMAWAAIESIEKRNKKAWLCPMIDARRMEVFMAVYDDGLVEICKPQSMILEKESLDDYLAKNTIYFLGSGSEKLKAISTNINAVFVNVQHTATHLGRLSYRSFLDNKFSELSISEPTYFKEFYFIS